ncbi:MAG: tetratricopeptide repeat protein [Alphaproteobacteria bacterium]|nr:tetratricopeptide repeat protein [Alphaproteobacteria bacterium]
MGISKDEVEAFKETLAGAENGDADAELIVGCCYADGAGVGKNIPKAEEWLRRAASHGSPKLRYMVGYIYARGYKGIEKNWGLAAEYLANAASLGHVPAMCDLLEHDGIKAPLRDDQAVCELYRKTYFVLH